MDELLKASSVQLIDLIQKGGEFIAGELPAFAQEVIQFGVVVNLVGVIASFVCFVGFVSSTIILPRIDDDLDPLALVTALLSVVSIIVSICYLTEYLKAVYAPRLFLLEALRGLL